jgi:hypothetical protein
VPFFCLLRLVISGGLHADFNHGHGTERDDGIADGCVRYTASQQAGDTMSGPPGARLGACLDIKFFPKFHYANKKFPITSKCRYMYEVLNVDEIKN